MKSLTKRHPLRMLGIGLTTAALGLLTVDTAMAQGRGGRDGGGRGGSSARSGGGGGARISGGGGGGRSSPSINRSGPSRSSPGRSSVARPNRSVSPSRSTPSRSSPSLSRSPSRSSPSATRQSPSVSRSPSIGRTLGSSNSARNRANVQNRSRADISNQARDAARNRSELSRNLSQRNRDEISRNLNQRSRDQVSRSPNQGRDGDRAGRSPSMRDPLRPDPNVRNDYRVGAPGTDDIARGRDRDRDRDGRGRDRDRDRDRGRDRDWDRDWDRDRDRWDRNRGRDYWDNNRWRYSNRRYYNGRWAYYNPGLGWFYWALRPGYNAYYPYFYSTNTWGNYPYYGSGIPDRYYVGYRDTVVYPSTVAEPAALGVTFGQSDVGVTVDSVIPGSPAEVAGLRPGDLITAVNGVAVTSYDQIIAMVNASQPGQTMQFELSSPEGEFVAEAVLVPRSQLY